MSCTARKVSVFGVFLRISLYLVQMREYTDQKTANTDTFHAVISLNIFLKTIDLCDVHGSAHNPIPCTIQHFF